MKLFRGGSSTESGQAPKPAQAAQRLSRRSSGLGELSRHWGSETGLCILDLGATSASNIRYMTERGHKIYSEDLLVASTDPSLATKDEQGNRVLDDKRFLSDNLLYPAAHFDAVLCWNLADYLDESLVKPVVGRLWSALKPGGMLLAFFHTRDAGPDAPTNMAHEAHRVRIRDMRPISGEVTEINERLDKEPALVNTDPYGEGWMIKIRVTDSAELDALLLRSALRAMRPCMPWAAYLAVKPRKRMSSNQLMAGLHGQP